MSSLVLIQYFSDKHKELTGEKYMIQWGKDNRIIQNMLKLYGLQKMCDIMDAFFESMTEDKFLKQTGASIGIMQTQLPKLLMQLKDRRHDKNIGRL